MVNIQPRGVEDQHWLNVFSGQGDQQGAQPEEEGEKREQTNTSNREHVKHRGRDGRHRNKCLRSTDSRHRDSSGYWEVLSLTSSVDVHWSQNGNIVQKDKNSGQQLPVMNNSTIYRPLQNSINVAFMKNDYLPHSVIKSCSSHSTKSHKHILSLARCHVKSIIAEYTAAEWICASVRVHLSAHTYVHRSQERSSWSCTTVVCNTVRQEFHPFLS